MDYSISWPRMDTIVFDPTQPIEDGLEINRQYLDADNQPVNEVKIGDIVDVVVTMRAHDNKTLREYGPGRPFALGFRNCSGKHRASGSGPFLGRGFQ